MSGVEHRWVGITVEIRTTCLERKGVMMALDLSGACLPAFMKGEEGE